MFWAIGRFGLPMEEHLLLAMEARHLTSLVCQESAAELRTERKGTLPKQPEGSARDQVSAQSL